MDNSCWRMMTPADLPQVEQLFQAQQKLLGTNFALPDFFKPPIVLCVVREEEGRIKRVICLETEVEVMSIGVEPIALHEVQYIADQMALFCRMHSIKMARAFVPAQLVEDRSVRNLMGGPADLVLAVFEWLGIVQKRKPRRGPVARLLERLGFVEEGTQLKSFYKWV